MNKNDIILAHESYLFPSVFHYYREPLVIERAKDQYVWDAEGRQYLDFFGGIVTISVGHCNDYVNGKIRAQMDKLQHCSTVFVNQPQTALAQKIASITPDRALDKCFFSNSGTEANETAILTARCYTGSNEIIALRHSYHGRSAMMMSATGHHTWRLGGAPQPGIVHAHNAYCYRCPFGLTYPNCEVRCATDIKELIQTSTSGKVAAFIAEPIQGVGGFITPPKEYFGIVTDIVRQHGGLFICDEVQTAWGRTGGKWFGIEHWGVTPDMITSAKGLGNGTPIAVTVAKPEIAAGLKGLTISTFGGNPIATTAGLAVLEYIEQNRLAENAESSGAYLRGRLEELKEKYPSAGDVRGMGLLQAIEIVEDPQSKAPSAALANRILEAARENSILVGKGGLYGNVIRISPPMNIERNDIDEFIGRLDRAFAAATQAVATA